MINPCRYVLSQVDDIEKVAHLEQSCKDCNQKILPGPYTLILNRKDTVSLQITGGTDKIGVRIPDNSICREISREFPITTTSANISGHPSPKSAQEARKELDDHPDIIIDSGPCSGGISSTVVDLDSDPTTHPEGRGGNGKTTPGYGKSSY